MGTAFDGEEVLVVEGSVFAAGSVGGNCVGVGAAISGGFIAELKRCAAQELVVLPGDTVRKCSTTTRSQGIAGPSTSQLLRFAKQLLRSGSQALLNCRSSRWSG